MPNPVGRPTSYSKEIYDISLAYLDNFESEHEHKFPSVVGLCKIIKRGSSTVYDWANPKHDSYHEEFSDIVSAINDYQHFELINKGISGEFNSNITKLLLGKHGHSDKQDIDHKGTFNVNMPSDDASTL